MKLYWILLFDNHFMCIFIFILNVNKCRVTWSVGDLMGPALSGLDHLVRLPTGCGEQNMLNFAPNIFILQYLTHTKQLTPAIETKTLEYMRTGMYFSVWTLHAMDMWASVVVFWNDAA